MTEKPYTDADVQLVASTFITEAKKNPIDPAAPPWTGVQTRALLGPTEHDIARAVLDALAATGRLSADTEPAPYLPGTVRGLAVYLQRMEMRVHHQLRRVDERIGRLEDRVDELHLEPEYDPADVQNLLDDSTRAFAAAEGSSERVEVICELLAGWYAAWPATAVTDPNEGIARHLVSLIDAAEAQAVEPARARLLAELTGGKRPCPWCTGAPVFDSAEALLAHARRHHLHPDDVVWLGDLSGYQVVTSGGDVTLLHRCGWTYPITNPVRGYLGNLITGPVSAHRDAGCNPHED